MPLVEPKLDERNFEQLLRDARLRIPQYIPEWTDFNDSDPGITLLQLYAWLTEIMLYEMNRLPELNYIKFLKMLGMELKPAQPSTAHLMFIPDAKSGVVSLRQYTRVDASPPDGTPVTFETTRGLDVTATPLDIVGVFDGTRPFNVTARNNDLRSETFQPFGSQALPGSILYLGFAVPKEEDLNNFPDKQVFPSRISLYVFIQQGVDAGEAQNATELRQPPPVPVKLVWESYHDDLKRWLPLSFDDETAAFQKQGYIYVDAPAQPAATIEPAFDPESRYWIRCRLESGNYPSGRIPSIDFIRANVVEAESLATVRDEIAGETEGRPEQMVQLSRFPVQPGSLDLEIRSGDQPSGTVTADAAPDRADVKWTRVDAFLASKPGDQHYTLNSTTGEIRFGDGIHGKVPPAGLMIIAVSYRYGGGKSSNVPANTITGLNSSDRGASSLTVTNERPPVGGADEQRLDDLKQQAPGQLRNRGRAVSAEDFETLALSVGGVRKAVALPLMNPNFPDVSAPGTVTVVIVPEGEAEGGGVAGSQPPVPSSDLIRAVLKFLDDKRPIATELYVKGPTYTTISIEATVEMNPQASAGVVRNAILEALRKNKLLNPYQQRFGQDFYPTSLYSVILGVEDVRAVQQLTVSVNGKQIESERLSEVCSIGRDGLVFGLDHRINTVLPPPGEP